MVTGGSELDFLGVNPGHQTSQSATDFLQLQAPVATAHGLEGGRSGAIFQNPLAGKLPRLNFVENTLHLGPRFLGDHPRPAAVITVLGGVGDTVAHVIEPTLVEQVDDQLELMETFKVGHFGLVASFHQRLEGRLDQLTDAAAEYDLFTE